MTGRTSRIDEAKLADAPSVPPRHRSPGRAELVAGGVVALQFAVLLAAIAVEPAATDETVAWQWVGDLLAAGFFGSLTIALMTVRSSSFSLRASAAAGGIGLALTLGCPISGHHAVAGWWLAQLSLFSVAAVAPIAAMLVLRRR